MSDTVKSPSKTLDRDEKIGYGNPPAATRFKPGVSGNPNGRPRKLESLAATFRRIATTSVNCKDSGEATTIPAIDLVVRRMFEKALLKHDTEAAKLMLAMAREFLPDVGEISEGSGADQPTDLGSEMKN
jgi:hypothetical protein